MLDGIVRLLLERHGLIAILASVLSYIAARWFNLVQCRTGRNLEWTTAFDQNSPEKMFFV